MAALLAAFRQHLARFAGVGAGYLDELKADFSTAPAGWENDMQRMPERLPESLAASSLSAREVEILDYVARGLSNKEITRALRVAPETIKWHLKKIFEKLNVHTRIQAVRSGLAFDMPTACREVPKAASGKRN